MSDWKDDTFDLNNPAYGLYPDAKTHVFRPNVGGYWIIRDGLTERIIHAATQDEAMEKFLAGTGLTPELTPADRALLASMGIKP